MKKFSLNEAIKFGWDTTKSNFSFLIKILLVVFTVYLFSGLISEKIKGLDPVTNMLIAIVFWIIQVIVGMGLVKITIEFVENRKPKLSDLYREYPLFFKYLAGAILAGVIVGIGFILLIIPGIIFSVKLKFVGFLIIDKGLGPIEAIKQSWKITKGQVWNLILLSLALTGLNILGMLAFLVGLLWTIPTSSIAEAYVYRKLSH